MNKYFLVISYEGLQFQFIDTGDNNSNNNDNDENGIYREIWFYSFIKFREMACCLYFIIIMARVILCVHNVFESVQFGSNDLLDLHLVP